MRRRSRSSASVGTNRASAPSSSPSATYDRLRLDSSRFVVCEGHELADIERVTERTPEYLVVEKAGRAPEAVVRGSPTGRFPSRRGSQPGRPRLPAAS